MTYRTGNHCGVTIVREATGSVAHGEGPALVAVVVNGDQALAERIARLLTMSEHVDTASKLAYQPETGWCGNEGHLDGYSRGLITGYRRAIATLDDCARRSGSPAARWAAEYLTVDPDGLRPREAAERPSAGGTGRAETAETPTVELTETDLRVMARTVHAIRPGIEVHVALAAIHALLTMGWRPRGPERKADQP